MIEYSKQVIATDTPPIDAFSLHKELIDRRVERKDALVIVECYNKMYTNPEYANGVFRIKNKQGKPIMNVFISGPTVNSLVSLYSPGAYYQLHIEEYDIFIVYKRFGSFHHNVLNSYITKRVREILSEGANVKKKKKK